MSRRSSFPAARGAGLAGLAVLLLAPLLFACAKSNVRTNERYGEERDVARPPVILVYEFAVSRSDVVVDKPGLAVVSDEAPVSDQQALAKEVALTLAHTMVAALQERELKAERGILGEEPPLNALLVKGEFRSIDEGDQMARVTLGFGAGKSKVQVVMEVFQQTLYGAKMLVSGDAKASGSRMPGMLVPVGAGAMMGNAATSAVVSGTMTGIRELKGPLGADLKRISEDFAERAEAFYKRRGWR